MTLIDYIPKLIYLIKTLEFHSSPFVPPVSPITALENNNTIKESSLPSLPLTISARNIWVFFVKFCVESVVPPEVMRVERSRWS